MVNVLSSLCFDLIAKEKKISHFNKKRSKHFLFSPKYYFVSFPFKDNKWAGNKYLLPIKSYIEPPTTKQTEKREREILLSFWDMTFGFKGLVTFSDVTVNIEEMFLKKRKKGKKLQQKLHFLCENSGRYKEERWPNISYSGYLITSHRHKCNH